jgi:hypothetical protein
LRFFIGCTYSICVVGVAFSVFVATLFVLYYLYVQNVATIEKIDRKVWPQIDLDRMCGRSTPASVATDTNIIHTTTIHVHTNSIHIIQKRSKTCTNNKKENSTSNRSNTSNRSPTTNRRLP